MDGIEIYQTADNQAHVEVHFDGDTFWLNQHQLAELFDSDRTSILKHIHNIYAEDELTKESTCAKFVHVRKEGTRAVKREILHYNLDLILSVGYRINSKRGTQFRQWATQSIKEYLVQGYIINERRLLIRQQQVENLKAGIKILSRAITQQATIEDSEMLQVFAKGLELLDDYDHENLDNKGKTVRRAVYPDIKEYWEIIGKMKLTITSDLFANPKDNSFESSVKQIAQCFDDKDLYQSIEEKAATLLYLIVKNHSFVDGNKRISAACFLHFLKRNEMLYTESKLPIISNEALASITLFAATSMPEEMETVKQLIISILNRNR